MTPPPIESVPPDARFRLACSYEIDPDGDVVLIVPPPSGFWARLMRGSRPRRIQLEKMGSAVVKACLEGASLAELPARLAVLFPEQGDLERRSFLFVRHLLAQGWLRRAEDENAP